MSAADINILDLLREKGIDAKKAAGTHGGEYHSPCPGCGGDDRFHVWPDQNDGRGSYWCRQCRKAGDAIQFLIDFDGLTYPQACERLNIPLSSRPGYRTPRPPANPAAASNQAYTPTTPQTPPDPWQEKAEKFIDYCHKKLLSAPSQLKQLRERGIGKKTVRSFKLGWADKDRWRPRESWGLPDEFKENGKKKKLWFPLGLVIPVIRNGTIARIRVRRPEGKPRYYLIPGSDVSMMVLNPGSRAAVVVESELDAILIHQAAGDVVTTVALGSSSVKPDAAALEELKKAAIILLAHDFDDAGKKVRTWWEEQFRQAERWPVPSGKDPGDAFKAGVDIRSWVTASLPKSWSVGQTLLGSVSKEAGLAVEGAGPGSGGESASPGPAEIPEPVRELAALLKKCPLAIINQEHRLRVAEAKKWSQQNWEISRRISELVFLTPVVTGYLISHPAVKINGQNIIIQGATHE